MKEIYEKKITIWMTRSGQSPKITEQMTKNFKFGYLVRLDLNNRNPNALISMCVYIVKIISTQLRFV
jgi:hypothetical protein